MFSLLSEITNLYINDMCKLSDIWKHIFYSHMGIPDLSEWCFKMYLLTFGHAGSSLLRGLFSSCGSRGCFPVAVRGLLPAAASLEEPRLNSCGSQAPEHRLLGLLRDMWDLLGSGIKLPQWEANSLPLTHQGKLD